MMLALPYSPLWGVQNWEHKPIALFLSFSLSLSLYLSLALSLSLYILHALDISGTAHEGTAHEGTAGSQPSAKLAELVMPDLFAKNFVSVNLKFYLFLIASKTTENFPHFR